MFIGCLINNFEIHGKSWLFWLCMVFEITSLGKGVVTTRITLKVKKWGVFYVAEQNVLMFSDCVHHRPYFRHLIENSIKENTLWDEETRSAKIPNDFCILGLTTSLLYAICFRIYSLIRNKKDHIRHNCHLKISNGNQDFIFIPTLFHSASFACNQSLLKCDWSILVGLHQKPKNFSYQDFVTCLEIQRLQDDV